MNPEDLKALKLALDKRHELESFHRFKRRLSEKEKVLLLKGAALASVDIRDLAILASRLSGETLKVAAEEVGLTKQRVCVIENKYLRRLTARVNELMRAIERSERG